MQLYLALNKEGALPLLGAATIRVDSSQVLLTILQVVGANVNATLGELDTKMGGHAGVIELWKALKKCNTLIVPSVLQFKNGEPTSHWSLKRNTARAHW